MDIVIGYRNGKCGTKGCKLPANVDVYYKDKTTNQMCYDHAEEAYALGLVDQGIPHG